MRDDLKKVTEGALANAAKAVENNRAEDARHWLDIAEAAARLIMAL